MAFKSTAPSERCISWDYYVHAAVNMASYLREMEVKWNQYISDAKVIDWYIQEYVIPANKIKGKELSEIHLRNLVYDYNLLIGKMIQDGIVHVESQYCDPIDNNTVRVIKVDSLFFPHVWKTYKAPLEC